MINFHKKSYGLGLLLLNKWYSPSIIKLYFDKSTEKMFEGEMLENCILISNHQVNYKKIIKGFIRLDLYLVKIYFYKLGYFQYFVKSLKT